MRKSTAVRLERTRKAMMRFLIERKYNGVRGIKWRTPEAEARIKKMAELREQGKTLRDIGKIVGLSGERVRQLLSNK